MNNNQISYFSYHIALFGYKFFKNNKEIPKFILYLRGVNTDDLLLSRTGYQSIKRK